VGLFDWLKRKNAGDLASTTISVTTSDLSVDAQDPQQREALEQAERLIHDLLTAGPERGSAGAGDEGGASILAASTRVIVDGQTVGPNDPRALEAMGKAAAKLRAQGLDELAAELEAGLGAAAGAATAMAGAAPAAARAADATANTAGAVDAASSAPADGLAAAPDTPAEDFAAAPDAPTPPEPPAPPA